MNDHTVKSFGEQLEALSALVAQMGGLAEAQLAAAIEAIARRDSTAAERAVAGDVRIDEIQQEIEERALRLLALRQPMAVDLRETLAAIKTAAELERIGDLAKNIAKRVGAVGDAVPPRRFAHGIDAMTDLVLTQVKGVVHKYEERDAEGLSGLRAEDEKIDIQYTGVFRELLTYMMEDPRNITACTHLLFCAKNLERIGDHVTNIAENAYYIVTGRQLSPDRPKQDETATLLAE